MESPPQILNLVHGVSPLVNSSLKNIGNWAVIILLLIGLILVYGVMRANGFNIYLFSAGAICIIIPLLIFYKFNRELNEPTERDLIIKVLKEDGHRIEVDLAECEVIEINSSEKSIDGIAERTSVIGGRIPVKVRYEGHKGSAVRVQYKTYVNNTVFKFRSKPLSKDASMIRMLLDYHKTANLYVDKTDATCYYFDLDFLYESAHNIS